MASRQKNRERTFSATADPTVCAPRLVPIYQNHAASIADATAPVRIVADNDYRIRGMSLHADIIATSVKADIKVNGAVKITGTVTVADKAVYFRPTSGKLVEVPAGAEVSCDIDVTGTCGGINVYLDTVP